MTNPATPPPPPSGGRMVRRGNLNVLKIPEGATVLLASGATAEVLVNQRDGYWLTCRYLSSPDDPDLEGEVEQVFVTDVIELIEQAEPSG